MCFYGSESRVTQEWKHLGPRLQTSSAARIPLIDCVVKPSGAHGNSGDPIYT